MSPPAARPAFDTSGRRETGGQAAEPEDRLRIPDRIEDVTAVARLDSWSALFND